MSALRSSVLPTGRAKNRPRAESSVFLQTLAEGKTASDRFK